MGDKQRATAGDVMGWSLQMMGMGMEMMGTGGGPPQNRKLAPAPTPSGRTIPLLAKSLPKKRSAKSLLEYISKLSGVVDQERSLETQVRSLAATRLQAVASRLRHLAENDPMAMMLTMLESFDIGIYIAMQIIPIYMGPTVGYWGLKCVKSANAVEPKSVNFVQAVSQAVDIPNYENLDATKKAEVQAVIGKATDLTWCAAADPCGTGSTECMTCANGVTVLSSHNFMTRRLQQTGTKMLASTHVARFLKVMESKAKKADSKKVNRYLQSVYKVRRLRSVRRLAALSLTSTYTISGPAAAVMSKRDDLKVKATSGALAPAAFKTALATQISTNAEIKTSLTAVGVDPALVTSSVSVSTTSIVIPAGEVVATDDATTTTSKAHSASFVAAGFVAAFFAAFLL